MLNVRALHSIAKQVEFAYTCLGAYNTNSPIHNRRRNEMSAQFGKALKATLVSADSVSYSLVLYRNKEWDEYVAVVYYDVGDNKQVVATYHTDSLNDVVATGRNELDHCIKHHTTTPLNPELW